MKYLMLSLICFSVAFLPILPVYGQSDSAITSPVSGMAVQGKVDVHGYIKATNFAGYDLDFSHENETESGWFNISTNDRTPEDGLLGNWDTSSISDGNYQLRLTVRYKDDTKSEIIVEKIRVRNYSPIETDTPSPGIAEKPANPDQGKPTFPAPAFSGVTSSRNEIEITTGDFQTTLFVSIGVGVILVILLINIFKSKNE
jgi:hypothetical protein